MQEHSICRDLNGPRSTCTLGCDLSFVRVFNEARVRWSSTTIKPSPFCCYLFFFPFIIISITSFHHINSTPSIAPPIPSPFR